MDVKTATGDMTNVKQAAERSEKQTQRNGKKSGGPVLLDRLFPLLLLGVCNGASHKPSIKMLSESML